MTLQYCEIKAALVELANKPFLDDWLAVDNRVKCEVAATERTIAGSQEKIRIIGDYLEYLGREAQFFRILENDAQRFFEEFSRCDDREVLLAAFVFGQLRGEHENAIKVWQAELTKAKQMLGLRRYWKNRRGGDSNE